MDKRKRWYKYCIVPGCKSTSVSTPNKIFISLPSDENVRNLWQGAMRRKTFVSNKGAKFCCEDHFNLEEDMENYMYYKTMNGGKIKLKPGVIPHIFDCQENEKPSLRPQFIKRKIVMGEKQNFKTSRYEITSDASAVHESKYSEKCVQANLKPFVRSKSVQCSFSCTHSQEELQQCQERKINYKSPEYSKEKLKTNSSDSSTQSSFIGRSTSVSKM